MRDTIKKKGKRVKVSLVEREGRECLTEGGGEDLTRKKKGKGTARKKGGCSPYQGL